MTNTTNLTNKPVIAMSALGKHGRFGNQLFQYAFLRICAENSNSQVECPSWIGQTLFGHQDAPISRQLPPAVEILAMFDIFPEIISYLEKIANAKSCRVSSENLEHPITNVDIHGFFQFNTVFFAPYKQYFRDLFQPVSSLKSPLENGLNLLRSKGKTVVGIHIRRGDYIAEPQAGFTLVFPAKWYCEYLDQIWNELDNPVLFLCSDDLDHVLPNFKKYSPVVGRDLQIQLPESMRHLNLDFYIDFFVLSKCDVICISNSSFSFAACMLNENGSVFVRPHWDFSTKFTVFDPWNSEPVLWLVDKQTKFFKSFYDIVHITYMTQGMRGMIKSIFIYYPLAKYRSWANRFNLAYKTNGMIGLFKTFFHIFWGGIVNLK